MKRKEQNCENQVSFIRFLLSHSKNPKKLSITSRRGVCGIGPGFSKLVNQVRYPDENDAINHCQGQICS